MSVYECHCTRMAITGQICRVYHTIFTWVPGIEHRSPVLFSQGLKLLQHLASFSLSFY